MFRFIIYLTIYLLLSAGTKSSHAATLSQGDLEVLRSFWIYADSNRIAELPVNKRIPEIALFFLGTPYKSNTLNVTKKELPVINLRELDCVTLVENVLALAFLNRYDSCSIPQFIDNIVKLRYRNGLIEDYASRLHYSTDWLYEMQRQKFLSDVTQAAGGIKYPMNICFMSQNYTRYPVLSQDKKLIPKIRTIETDINKRTYYYIPKGKVKESDPKIENGDILLITTNIKGLDTSHLGFVVKKNDKIYMLHASSLGKKVMVTEQPLREYMQKITSQTGIIIARVTEKYKIQDT